MKGNVFLIHWHAAEAEKHAEELRSYGWNVVGIESEDGVRGGKTVKDNPPDALVIYLTRLPSHGRETAHTLRYYKATKKLPIIFVGGQGEALEKIKAKIPDALYVAPEALQDTLEQIAMNK